MSKNRLDWLKASAAVLGSVAAATRAVVDYRKFRRDQESLEYTRGMQRKAWQQVVDGELSSAKVGDVEVKAPTEKQAGVRKTRTTSDGQNIVTTTSSTTTPGDRDATDSDTGDKD